MQYFSLSKRSVFALLVIALSACGGGSSDSGNVTVDPVENEILLVFSDNFDRCGNPVSQEVTVSILDEGGTILSDTFDHAGVERTYSFGMSNAEPKTVQITKPGTSINLVEIAPNTSTYVRFSLAEESDTCGCSEYDIRLSSAVIAEAGDEFNLSIATRNASLGVGDSRWDDIEVCDHERDALFVHSVDMNYYGKVTLDSSSVIVDSVIRFEEEVVLDPGLRSLQQWLLTDADGIGELDDMFFPTWYSSLSSPPSDVPRLLSDPAPNGDVDLTRIFAQFEAGFVSVTNVGDLFGGAEPNGSTYRNYLRVTNEAVQSEGAALLWDGSSEDELDITISDNSMLLNPADVSRFDFVLIFSYGFEDTRDADMTFIPIGGGSISLEMLNEHDPAHDLYVVALIDVHGSENYTDNVQDFLERYLSGDDYRATEIIMFWQ